MSTLQAPRQTQFDLRLPTGRPLYSVNAAMAILDRDEDDILSLIERGLLLYAFDIRTNSAERAEVRIWRESIIAYAKGDFAELIAQSKALTGTVRLGTIRSLLPKGKRSLRRWEVARLLNCSGQHVGNLVTESLLTIARAGNRLNISDDLTTESVVAFLSTRSLP